MTPEYRAWDKRDKKLRPVAAMNFSQWWLDTGKLTPDTDSMFEASDRHNFEDNSDRCNRFVLEQYIGVEDKNVNKIFEGDIVSISNHPFQRHKGDLTGIDIEGNYEINWSERDLTWLAGMWKCSETRHYLTVIGNIHENSELLEEKA